MQRRGALAAILTVAVAVSAGVWFWRSSSDEAVIRARLDAFVEEVNASTTDGFGIVARAATIGSYFTDEVTVDLGRGTSPISGRETIIGMAARLQPRTSAFRLKLDDVDVRLGPGKVSADVTLTASFIRRSISTGEEAMDAREFRLALAKTGGTWRFTSITAVDTLK